MCKLNQVLIVLLYSFLLMSAGFKNTLLTKESAKSDRNRFLWSC